MLNYFGDYKAFEYRYGIFIRVKGYSTINNIPMHIDNQ